MMDTIVVGAGVVGLSVATHLARSGVKVQVVDELPPASGASYGNSGFLVADTAMPVALPGMYKKVPSWLCDKDGPLRVRPGYLPRVTPFLLRWLHASRLPRVNASSDAMRRLHHPTFDEWRRLVGDATYAELIRKTGQMYLWEGDGPFPTPVEDALRAKFGVKTQSLSKQEIQDLYPGISPSIGRAMLIPGNGHTVNPGRLCQAVLRELINAGGSVMHERVQRIWPKPGGGWTLMTSGGLRACQRIVIAAGAWSARLLAPLGIHVPLESERGYHVILPNPSVSLPIPILHKTGYFGINSMQMGLRLSGTVELAGLEAEPDPRRCDVLVRQARSLFPNIEHDDPVYWMGHRPSVPDSVPVIGPVPERDGLFVCFGHGHCGLTAGPASARMLVRQMLGDPVEFDAEPYSIRRFM
ncbi:MAG: FAD-binding oxidoreductase [Pandoraea sp.]|nr:FAD-binding oxidoreductase [Pandoraea sp.]MDR3400752.1 FAD-binding oxidoreductase [Pandoraea sp.]